MLSCSGEQRLSILSEIKSQLLELATHKRATHVIQTFVDLINLPLEEQVFGEQLEGSVSSLSVHPLGTHIIQKFLVGVREENREFVFREITGDFLNISKDKYGLCVLKKFAQNITSF